MANDDYDVIVSKISFAEETLAALISKADIPDEYFADILRLMQSEGLNAEQSLIDNNYEEAYTEFRTKM